MPEDTPEEDSDAATDPESSDDEASQGSESKDDETEAVKELKSRFRFRVTNEDKYGFENEKDDKPYVEESSTEKSEALKEGQPKAAEVMRYFKKDKTYSRTIITILSSGLNDLLIWALSLDPRINHGRSSSKQRFSSPFEPVIQHWQKLEELTDPDAVRKALADGAEYKDNCTEEAVAKDMKMFLEIVQYTPDIRPYFRTERDLQKREQSVTFEMLWTIFPPGKIIYSTNQFKRPQFYMVDQADKGVSKQYDTPGPKDYWTLRCWYYDWDGSKFVRMAARCRFKRFEKSMPITKLPAYPIDYVKDCEGVEKSLIDRGRKFARLCQGPAKLSNYTGPGFLRGEVFEKTAQKFSKPALDSYEESNSGRTAEDVSKAPAGSTVRTHLIAK